MKDWKMTYLRRLGFGLFTSLIMKFTGLINNTFEGATIMLLVPILQYVVLPQVSEEQSEMNAFWGWLLADSVKFNLSGVGSIQLTTHLARKRYEWLQSSTESATPEEEQ